METNETAAELAIKQHLAHIRILARQLSRPPMETAEIYRLIGALAGVAEGILAGQITKRMIAALDRVADSLDTVLEDDAENRFRPVRFVRTA